MESLVSVIIPVYNRENTLKRAVDSVLNQTYRNIELVIVDDASTDDSLKIAKEYNNQRCAVRIISLLQNVGAAEARNIGMKVAEGEYIAFQDSDDEWFPNKLETQIRYMEKEKLKASFCPYILELDEHTCRIVPSKNEIRIIKEDGVKSALKEGNVIGTPTLVICREVMEEIGDFDNSMPSIEDYDYAIRLAQKYSIGFYPESLMKAYRQKISITTNKDAIMKGMELLIEKYSDFLHIENKITNTILFHTLDYENEFCNGLDRIRKGYAKGNFDKERYLDNLILHNLAQKYILMQKMEKYCREARIMELVDQNFAIYGAGEIGKMVYYGLKKRGLRPWVFIVSTYDDDMERMIDEIPIKTICDIDDKTLKIAVAVRLALQEKILITLKEHGFCNYFILDSLDVVG